MKYFKENFEFDYATGVKWALRTLGDRWKAHKYNLRGECFFPNKRKAEILAANPSDILPVEWTAFVDHYMDPKIKKQCLQNVRNREKLIVSHAGGSKSNARRATQMEKKLGRPEKITEHLSENQERSATKGIHSKVLAHLDDAIGKICGPENCKRVRGFSNAACPSDFGKSKRIFGGAICGCSSSALQQYVADLERQLQEANDQVATLYRFLQQKYGDELTTYQWKIHVEVVDELGKTMPQWRNLKQNFGGCKLMLVAYEGFGNSLAITIHYNILFFFHLELMDGISVPEVKVAAKYHAEHIIAICSRSAPMIIPPYCKQGDYYNNMLLITM
ncbi:uncharacterized protein LOC130957336 [Arachis stenosperma]|uniref:uncharacterized protein LOC130957336 n=1 Tax=Arachis stenosperma TaxID=217475 RepID=UPI0025ABB768|nr:uncharacterized protein LOC130957336 [Arachis stenosperma]